MAGYRGQRRMYKFMRREFFWTRTANNVYTTVSSCSTCARNGTSPIIKHELQLFPTSGPFKFVAINILKPLPRILNWNHYINTLTDRYSKHTRAMPANKSSSSYLANMVFGSWVVLYDTSAYVQSKNGVQSTSELFAALCTMLGMNHLKTIAYHPQTSRHYELYNHTIMTRLQHYVANNQTGWHTYVQPILFAYNAQVHKFHK